MRPKSFYKYCPIYSDDFENERSIENLINSHAVFSNRKNFNDLFDSKINFIKPTKEKLKVLAKNMSAKNRFNFKIVFLEDDWRSKCQSVEDEVSKVFDKYLYYCLTDQPDNNLMWSHYANSHRGFCIEWGSEYINADKVKYSDDIASFDIFDVVKSNYGLPVADTAGDQIWRALRQKLKEWEYESEYRLQLSNEAMKINTVKQFDNFSLVKYESGWVKSIIFGCRMSEEAKDYIRKNLPFNVSFKQAQEGVSSIKIKDIN
jgi:hypothetical protein